MRMLPLQLGRAVLLVALVLLLAFSWLPPSAVVLAHADLFRADPAPNSVLNQTPGRVTLWFTEPIEPRFSDVKVFDSQGTRVDNRDGVVNQSDPTRMSVTLPALANGTYTVAWRDLSAIDGHGAAGSYVFSVGEPTAGAPQRAATARPLLQSPLEPLVRWIGLLSILAAVGGLGFEVLVSRPALARSGGSKTLRGLSKQLESRTLKLVWLAMGLFGVASLGELVVRTAVANGVSLGRALGTPLIDIALRTDWGHLWLWRMALLLGMVLITEPREESPKSAVRLRQQLLRVLALMFGGGLLLTLSLASHGAAMTNVRAAGVFSDYLHLLAAGFWVGGLLHFALGLPLVVKTLVPRERRALLSAMVPRFSVLATVSVGTLIITGAYSAWAQVTVVRGVATPYGLALVAKVSLVVPLLVLGALNLRWVGPRLAKDDSAGRWLRRFVTGEAVLASLVLLAVGMLVSLEPARQVAARQGTGQEKGLTFKDTAEGAAITLQVVPGGVGPNKFVVTLKDRRGNPIDNASAVEVVLTYLDADVAPSSVSATPEGQGRYVVEEGDLNTAGRWKAEVVVRRPDAFDARAAFQFQVQSGGVVSSGVISPSAGLGNLLWGVELALLGLLFVGVGFALRGWRARSAALFMGGGGAAVVAGLFVLVSTQFL